MQYARVKKTCMLAIPLPEMWELLQLGDTLRQVAAGFVTYRGNVPARWEVGQEVDIKPKFVTGLLSLLPTGKHLVKVMRVDHSRHLIETIESGGLVKYWNHVMKIDSMSENFIRYSDEVVIEAGWATNIVASLADDLYRHRQSRWQEISEERLKVRLANINT